MLAFFFYVLCAVAAVFVIAGFVALFAGPGGRGVPFVPTSKKRIATMLRLAGDVRGKRVIDLGSGDGRLVIAFARAGAEAHGYELNPVLVWLSQILIALRGLRGSAHVTFGNYWHSDVSGFDIVLIYGFPPTMKALEKKFREELRPGSVVLSNGFTFPTWPALKKEEGILVYRKQ